MVNLTEAELELSERIDQAKDRGSGTVWTRTREWLASMLGLPIREVGAISIKDRAVIGNRLCTPGVIRMAPRIFLVASLEDDYTNDVLLDRTKELVPLTRHLTTVLIARPTQDPEYPDQQVFRVTDAVVVDDLNSLDVCLPHFPGLTNIVHMPITPLGGGTAAVNSGKRAWYSREALPPGAAAWFGTMPVGTAPAVGERVLFLEDGDVEGKLRLSAHGVVSEARLADAVSVSITVSDIRRPAEQTWVDLADVIK